MSSIQQDEHIYCVILTGGESSRMKTHKALLRFTEHENFLQHIIAVYQSAGVSNIIVVKNKNINLPAKLGNLRNISIINNDAPEKGRFYSVQSGLQYTRSAHFCFLQNIDNPFVNEDLLRQLFSQRFQADYITPQYNNRGGHPILISAPVIESIVSVPESAVTLRDFLLPYSRYRMTTDDSDCLININNAAEYETTLMTHLNTITQQ